jgi:hypothetical protein
MDAEGMIGVSRALTWIFHTLSNKVLINTGALAGGDGGAPGASGQDKPPGAKAAIRIIWAKRIENVTEISRPIGHELVFSSFYWHEISTEGKS